MLVPIAILIFALGTAGAATGQFNAPVTKTVTPAVIYPSHEGDLEQPLSPVDPIEPVAPEPVKVTADDRPAPHLKAVEKIERTFYYDVQPEERGIQ